MEMPDWFAQWKARGGYSPGAWGAPAPIPTAAPTPDPNAAMRAMAMSGDASPYAPTGFSSAQTVGPDATSFSNTPLPPPRPAQLGAPSPASAGGGVPLPPTHNGGNWATTTALEGDPAGQLPSALPDWATPGAQQAAAAENRQIGPGSWLDPSKLGGMVGKNSLIGKLLALRNTSDAPQTEKHQGLLSGLFNDGSVFGRDPTTPNSTIGGLW